jgi:DNA end-binding protein Ku
MAAKAIWKGSLSFGLVTFPISVYKATDDPDSGTAMKELHGVCKHPAGRKHHCEFCKIDILASDIVKGVPLDKDTFVVITPEELDTIRPETSAILHVDSFAPAADVDPIYIRSTHFMTADGKVGYEPYALLAAALIEQSQVAQGRWTIYGREQNVIVRPLNGGLVIHMIRTVTEVRSMDALPNYQAPGAVPLNPAALKMLSQFMGSMTAEFDATEYEDTFAADFKTLVAKKIAGETIASAPGVPAPLPANDLMTMLKASLVKPPAPSKKVVKTPAAPKAKAKKAKAS